MTKTTPQNWHQTISNDVELCQLTTRQKGKSAIAISVGCGHFNDPENCQGLTHLLEHLLFMGSTNNPMPNSVIKLIEDLGGSINAFTSSEVMAIQCHFPTESMELVCAAVADLIANPLFLTESISSEIETIDAEFKFKYQDDLRRLYDVHKDTCNPDHPFSKFSVGNRSVFEQFKITELKSMLEQHHRTYFIGSNVKVCVMSDCEPIVAQEILATELSKLPHGSSLVSPSLPALYLPQQLGVQICVKPLIDAKRLILTFPLPGLTAQNRRSLSVISHIFGDENKGSALGLLKSAGWVSNLSAGGGIEGSNFKDFNINLQLTSDGEQHVEDVIHTVLSYIKLLDEPEDWRLTEKLHMEQLFKDNDEINPSAESASDFAEGMHQYPVEELIILHQQPQKACKTDIKHLLKLFNIGNLRVKLISKNASTHMLSRWYNTEYAITPISKEQQTNWLRNKNPSIDLESLSLPKPNPYVSEHVERRVSVVSEEMPYPYWQKDNAELWVAGAPMFKQRTADCYISFECPANTEGAGMMAAKRLWIACLNDVLQSQYYAAEIAGLNYRLYGHQGGFSIHTSGFSIRQAQLVTELIDQTLNENDFAKWFKANKDSQANSLKNHLLNKPVNRLFTRLGVLMQRHSHSPQTILENIEKLSFSDTLNARDSLLDQFAIQGFMHGHWRKDDAHEVADVFDSIRYFDKQVTPVNRDVAKLTPQYTYFQEVESSHPESAALLFLQAPSADPLHIALTMIFEQLLATPFFDELRTKKQLGYVVGSGFVAHNAHPGMAFYIQSPTVDANTLIHEMTQFLMGQLAHIDYYQKFWRQIQNNIIRQLLAKDINTTNRAQRLWMSLGLKDNRFNRNLLIAEQVKQFSFDDLVAHATEFQQRLTFGELVLFHHGKFNPNEAFLERNNALKINNVHQFKESVPYAD